MLSLNKKSLWIVAIALAVIVLLLISFRYQSSKINDNPLPSWELSLPLQEEDLKGAERVILESPRVEVNGTDLVVSSGDGEVKMRISSDYAVSKEGIVSVPFAQFELFFKEDRKVLLYARDLTYRILEDSAQVSGELSGEITPLGQRFSAKGLVWNRKSSKVALKGVGLIDPFFSVNASHLEYDIETNVLQVKEGAEVRF